MWTKLRNAVSVLDTVGGVASGVVVVFMLFMLAINTVLRYIFNTGWFFAQEYTGYGLVFLTFVPLAYTLKQRGHIAIDAVVDRLPARARKRMAVLTTALSLVIVTVLLHYGALLAFGSLARGTKSNTVMLTPLWIPQMFVVIGLLIFIPELVCHLIDRIKESRSD